MKSSYVAALQSRKILDVPTTSASYYYFLSMVATDFFQRCTPWIFGSSCRKLEWFRAHFDHTDTFFVRQKWP